MLYFYNNVNFIREKNIKKIMRKRKYIYSIYWKKIRV